MAFSVAKSNEVQAKVMAKLTAKMAAKNEARFDLVIDILFALSAAGLLLLLLPLFLRRRYPGASLGFVWILVSPFLFIFGASEVIDLVLAGARDGDWAIVLASGPLILVLGFLVLYWLLRGLRAQKYIFRYKVAAANAAAPA